MLACLELLCKPCAKQQISKRCRCMAQASPLFKRSQDLWKKIFAPSNSKLARSCCSELRPQKKSTRCPPPGCCFKINGQSEQGCGQYSTTLPASLQESMPPCAISVVTENSGHGLSVWHTTCVQINPPPPRPPPPLPGALCTLSSRWNSCAVFGQLHVPFRSSVMDVWLCKCLSNAGSFLSPHYSKLCVTCRCTQTVNTSAKCVHWRDKGCVW